MHRRCASKQGLPGCCLPDPNGNLDPGACDQCSLTRRLLTNWRLGPAGDRWCDRLLGDRRPPGAGTPDRRDQWSSLRKWREENHRQENMFGHRNTLFRAVSSRRQ